MEIDKVEDGETLRNAFIRHYCNNHNKRQGIRWLRGIFMSEEEKLHTILNWLQYADDLIKEESLKNK